MPAVASFSGLPCHFDKLSCVLFATGSLCKEQQIDVVSQVSGRSALGTEAHV